MPYNKKEIKTSGNGKGKTLVKVSGTRPLDNKIVFSFSFFNGQSIHYRDFNNFYANEQDSKKSVSDFFETIKLMSNLEPKELFSANIKKQYHYNEFDDNLIIDRIETILINGYGMTRKKVDEFERMYFEFSFGNGKRAIGTKIYDNIFQILFIDCNHLVCIESARNIKLKNGFSYPSVFEKVNNEITIEQFQHEELFQMLIDSAREGAYTNIDDFIQDYDDLFVEL